MCVSPPRLPNGNYGICRDCWQCQANRINDLVGRCCAEQATSDQTFSVTLTYAGDTPNTVVFCYRDIQLFLKRFHKAGYNVRYIVAGEYGHEKGRVHWHIVIFLKGKQLRIVDAYKRENDWDVVLPRFKDDPAARIQFAPWSDPAEGRGFCYFQYPDYGGFRYAMKYALKNQSKGSDNAFGLSKKPPLGYEFFIRMADDMVAAHLPLHKPAYSFMDQLDGKGRHREFWLQGRMRELFLDRYRLMWRLQNGDHFPPETEWFLERYLDKLAARDMFDERLEREFLAKKFGADNQYSGRQVGILMLPDVRSGMVFAYEYAAHVLIGEKKWVLNRNAKGPLVPQLLTLGLKKPAAWRVSSWLHEKWSLSPLP